MKVKKNDTVLVITGKDAGKTGKVISASPADNKIKVDGVNVQKRSKKARSANETSAIVPQIGAIDASNVMVVCPKCGKATRVAHKIVDGKKVRVCKKCGASLDVAPEAKKAIKKADKKAVGEEKTAAPKKAAKKSEADAPKKATKKATAEKAETAKAEETVEKTETAKTEEAAEKPAAPKKRTKKTAEVEEKAE